MYLLISGGSGPLIPWLLPTPSPYYSLILWLASISPVSLIKVAVLIVFGFVSMIWTYLAILWVALYLALIMDSVVGPPLFSMPWVLVSPINLYIFFCIYISLPFLYSLLLCTCLRSLQPLFGADILGSTMEVGTLLDFWRQNLLLPVLVREILIQLRSIYHITFFFGMLSHYYASPKPIALL